jgi:hypothetical protein
MPALSEFFCAGAHINKVIFAAKSLAVLSGYSARDDLWIIWIAWQINFGQGLQTSQGIQQNH